MLPSEGKIVYTFFRIKFAEINLFFKLMKKTHVY